MRSTADNLTPASIKFSTLAKAWVVGLSPSGFKVPMRHEDDGDNGDCNDEQAGQWKSAPCFNASWSEPGCR